MSEEEREYREFEITSLEVKWLCDDAPYDDLSKEPMKKEHVSLSLRSVVGGYEQLIEDILNNPSLQEELEYINSHDDYYDNLIRNFPREDEKNTAILKLI